jgi:hypothetical protein
MASVDGVVIRVVALADIIDSKQHADRTKDRDALPDLEELRRRQPGPAET